MDFYAMQLIPRKKKDDKEKREQQLKKFREHVITKDELLSDLKPKVDQAVVQDAETKVLELDSKKNVSPDFLSTKSFSISKNDPEAKGVDEVKIKSSEIRSAFVDEEKTSPKKIARDIWGFNEKQKDFSQENSIVPIKAKAMVPEIKKNTEIKKPEEKTNPTPVVGNEQLGEIADEKIMENLLQAVLADDEKKIRIAIEDLISFRSKDPIRFSQEFDFNIKLKEKLITAIPALFGYRGGKSVLHLFQLLDQLGIKFVANDLSKLPDEVLKSEDLKNVCEKYLIWFVKEYPDFPGQLQDKIYYFNKCGILSYQEIRGFSGLQLAINSDLINFIKSNVRDPHDVERKIYEFALAGLVNEKEFKQEAKVRDIIKKFIATLVASKKDKPQETAKKIGEYERIGIIRSSDILQDDKIERAIEKYLVKFKKENRDHPRKFSMLVKDYFNAGLIDKKTRDRLL